MAKDQHTLPTDLPVSRPDQGEELLQTYGSHLTDLEMSEAQQKELLLVLWNIMQCFADLAFTPKAGDKNAANAAPDIKDVLNWIILRETAPETVASLKFQREQERP